MTEVNGKQITMTRGDTFRCIVGMVTKSGIIVTPKDGDRIVFTVKKKYSDTHPLLQIEIPTDTMLLEIQSKDTKDWQQPAEYVYDIQLIRADGTVDTFIDRATLRIMEEVG